MTDQPAAGAPAPAQSNVKIGPLGIVLKRRADAAEASEINFAVMLEQAQAEIAVLKAEIEALKADKTGKGKS